MTWRGYDMKKEKNEREKKWEQMYEIIHYMNGAGQWKMSEYGENHVYVDEITIINNKGAIPLGAQGQLLFFHLL